MRKKVDLIHGVLKFRDRIIIFGQNERGKLTQIEMSTKQLKHLSLKSLKTKHIDAY